MAGGGQDRRSYHSPLRREQAELTRRRILGSAHRLLVDRGWAGTGITAVALAAGVSVQTVYAVFGSKGHLVRRVYELAADAVGGLVPLAQQPAYQALRSEPDPAAKLAQYAAIVRETFDRLGPLWLVLRAGAATGDPLLRGQVELIDRDRLLTAEDLARQVSAVGGLRAGLSVERAGDVLWLLTAPTTYELLVRGRGWSLAEVEGWLADTTTAALIGPTGERASGPPPTRSGGVPSGAGGKAG
jgi:TetR/AcrR family transcriptional regulator of autoinduction and epiphytic fitness